MKDVAQIERIGDELHVRCPYNVDVIREFRSMRGRWDANGKVWIFPARLEWLTHTVVRSHFDVDGPMPEKSPRRTQRTLQEIYRE